MSIYTEIDWDIFGACPSCPALAGEQCRRNFRYLKHPHTGRMLRDHRPDALDKKIADAWNRKVAALESASGVRSND